ncbi:Asparagine synthetase [glutamine-hydrolyzing] 3 [Planctomycetes bacterium Poly30]|uniref:asparagine synthase (glutamine-hydrolyzing) n=1 Tax=Saltatorellus ferox TaxID=2528018 RepID=A0A518F089_9BACT|nr:Asparagine synthetase [glutamine-hydrolyzing] 3 [Planctomycetes bacterium Poly30]
MCGVFGSVARFGEVHGVEESALRRILDALSHRGPDGQGTWSQENVLLGHTRLAVRDPGAEAAAQPILTPHGRHALVYNGELYNDRELRAQLEPRVLQATGGRGFRTACDAETVLWALALDGEAAFDRLRGMYALAFVDVASRTMLLARDPLGVKPLVWSATSDGGMAFASEPRALLQHPRIERRPDEEMIGAYLVTSRRTMGDRTLFEGVRSVPPGSVLRVDLSSSAPRPVEVAGGARLARRVQNSSASPAACRDLIEDSVLAQLVSDVPVCAFLSGGLDSAILTRLAADERARRGADPLATWCASAFENGEELGPDPPMARAFARKIGSTHTDVHTDEAAFLTGWRDHVEHLWQPLSTPNEVAIAATSRAIRQAGALVALSGEGADELFGGYDSVLAAFAAHSSMDSPPIGAARFHLEISSWVSPAALHQIMTGARAERIAASLVEAHEEAFRKASLAAGPYASDLDAHLRLQRTMNLTPLLERLDAATMRYGIEGRTPFADERVLAFADRLPFAAKFEVRAEGQYASKKILREAFRSILPAEIVDRPKASFPMPFERWSAGLATRATASPFVQEWIQPAAVEAVAADPARHWKLSWLIANLALFGEVAFGEPAEGVRRAA